MRQKNADKKSLANKKSEKFFFEGHIRVGYNKSIPPRIMQSKRTHKKFKGGYLKWQQE